jgi:hypothetical protein
MLFITPTTDVPYGQYIHGKLLQPAECISGEIAFSITVSSKK